MPHTELGRLRRYEKNINQKDPSDNLSYIPCVIWNVRLTRAYSKVSGLSL